MHTIIKLQDNGDSQKEYYLLWSIKEGKPITNGMSEEELEKHCKEKYGAHSMVAFSRKLERAKKLGCSSYHERIEDLMNLNCAGFDGEYLTKEEIIDEYCR